MGERRCGERVHVDSDWAQGPKDEIDKRRYADDDLNSGEALVEHTGDACVEHGRSQTGAAEALGMQLLFMDLGLSVQVRVWTDSMASKALASRKGLGKNRHVELRYLPLQDMTKTGRVKMRRVLGRLNVADHMTKGQTWREIGEVV